LKPEYGGYLEALVGRLSPGALIAADNVLWSGRVSGARPSDPGDANTAALRAFDAAVLADERFTATILPLGDGLLIASWRGWAGPPRQPWASASASGCSRSSVSWPGRARSHSSLTRGPTWR